MEPLISVIMPAYNVEKYITEAVESILGQTFTHFEFIVIDDGSTDCTPKILSEYYDKRIVHLRYERNRGYVHALNHGLEIARGRFIARQDADDLSLPNRLAEQFQVLQQDPQTILVGSAYQQIDQQGNLLNTYILPEEDTSIRWRLLFQNSFAHSAVMFRAQIIRRHRLQYDPQFVPAEDYALWSKLLQHGKGYNITTPLVKIRKHDQQITKQKSEQKQYNAERIAELNLQVLDVTLPKDQLSTIRNWMFYFPRPLTCEEMCDMQVAFKLSDLFAQRYSLNKHMTTMLKRELIGHLVSHTRIEQWPNLWQSGLFSTFWNYDARFTLAMLFAQFQTRLVRRVVSQCIF